MRIEEKEEERIEVEGREYRKQVFRLHIEWRNRQIIERFKRATIAIKKTWRIGKRLFKDDCDRRVKMFNALVDSERYMKRKFGGRRGGRRGETGQIKKKYIKWILGLDKVTPNYILQLVEETKMKEIRTEAVKRAIKYEEKAWNREKKIVVECIKDLNKKRTVGEESQ